MERVWKGRALGALFESMETIEILHLWRGEGGGEGLCMYCYLHILLRKKPSPIGSTSMCVVYPVRVAFRRRETTETDPAGAPNFVRYGDDHLIMAKVGFKHFWEHGRVRMWESIPLWGVFKRTH